jgi:hypothetical protein
VGYSKKKNLKKLKTVTDPQPPAPCLQQLPASQEHRALVRIFDLFIVVYKFIFLYIFFFMYDQPRVRLWSERNKQIPAKLAQAMVAPIQK